MKTYEELKIEVVEFEADDVIVTSGYEEQETTVKTVTELPFVPADDMHG